MAKKRDPELVALAVKLYGELKSTQKVARRLELGTTTTHRLLKEAGVKMPGRFDSEVQERKKALKGNDAQQAAKDYAAGMSLAEMRKKYGVGTWAIKTAAKDHGVETREIGGRHRKFSEGDQQEMVRLYKAGWTHGQIGVKYNSNQSMIRRILVSRGIAVRGDRASGKNHGSWNGGRVNIGGYVAVLVERTDPMISMAHHTGYVLEHRLVMARALGRPLFSNETVHHVDGDKHNNAIGNLQLRFGKHGKGKKLQCRCCGSSDIVEVEL